MVQSPNTCANVLAYRTSQKGFLPSYIYTPALICVNIQFWEGED